MNTLAEQWIIDKIGYMPRGMSLSFTEGIKQVNNRDLFIKQFGFAIPTSEAIDRLKKYSPILEVGAGSGYWAFEMQKAGIDIIATDLHDFGTWTEKWQKHNYFPVEKLNALQAIQKYRERRTLMFVWPSYDENWATEALKHFQGDTIIYVGESDGGCTANDEFHSLLYSDFKIEEEIDIPQWWGIHDWLRIYTHQ